jgi:hypothetical protein
MTNEVVQSLPSVGGVPSLNIVKFQSLKIVMRRPPSFWNRRDCDIRTALLGLKLVVFLACKIYPALRVSIIRIAKPYVVSRLRITAAVFEF